VASSHTNFVMAGIRRPVDTFTRLARPGTSRPAGHFHRCSSMPGSASGPWRRCGAPSASSRRSSGSA